MTDFTLESLLDLIERSKRDIVYHESVKRAAESLLDALTSRPDKLHSRTQRVSPSSFPSATSEYAATRPPFTTDELALFQTGLRYNGIRNQVASRLGFSKSYVYKVTRGFHDAPAIIEAIRAAMRDADSRFDPLDLSPITPAERVHFKLGGKYYGLLSVVARKLGATKEGVFKAYKGINKTSQMIGHLRAEMARVDADLAAKAGEV